MKPNKVMRENNLTCERFRTRVYDRMMQGGFYSIFLSTSVAMGDFIAANAHAHETVMEKPTTIGLAAALGSVVVTGIGMSGIIRNPYEEIPKPEVEALPEV